MDQTKPFQRWQVLGASLPPHIMTLEHHQHQVFTLRGRGPVEGVTSHTLGQVWQDTLGSSAGH